MQVLIRADASINLGTGHIMRCKTMADALQQQGAEVCFACRELPGDLNQCLRDAGYRVYSWQSDAAANIPADLEHALSKNLFDWLIVDHYELHTDWEISVRPHVKHILAIDDLANRPHECDLLLDQNDLDPSGLRYKNLLPARCQLISGPQYALLRPEFAQHRSQLKPHSTTQAKRIFIGFGGSDPTGETTRLLPMFSQPAWAQYQLDLVVGASNPKRELIENWCKEQPNRHFHCQTPHMAKLMTMADIAIGAGGTTTWERLCLGLPSIVIAVAENQIEMSEAVAKAGAHLYLGYYESVSIAQIEDALTTIMRDSSLQSQLRERALSLVDGQGTARVAQALFRLALPQSITPAP